ncbi:hypothetical protein [Sphingomonas elodea]|uniref:hypothetical protein n=1 Tax=Sphingomonas elodea TaxID=179878 RepID=UPI00058B06D7|nr:hypothetical protein [Sphingomonas elodea]
MGAIATALLFYAVPDAEFDQKKEGATRYTFSTLLLPDRPADRTIKVRKSDPWLWGKALPAAAVVLDRSLTLPGTPFVIGGDELLSLANSKKLIACQLTRTVTVGLLGGGKSPICLIDRDGDGAFDGWYTSSVPVYWNGETAGHIQSDDIRAIAPIRPRTLGPEELRAADASKKFSIRYVHGELTFCIDANNAYCLSRGAKMHPGPAEQTVRFMRGEFIYRKDEDGMLVISIVQDPKEAVY